MINEWPQELVAALSPPAHPFAVWIGSGLACELGYPDWDGIVDRLIVRGRELQRAQADVALIEKYLLSKQLPQAAEVAYGVLGQAEFEQVLADAFDIREEEQGLQVCEDLLFVPFTVFVTTNYNRSLSEVARRLADDKRMTRLGDVVYPGGSPNDLWDRSVHYLHSDLNHVSDVVMRDSTFTSAYGASGPQRKVVEALAGLFNIVFIGTDFCDSDLRRVWQECKDIFQPGTGTLRFALTQADGEAAPTRNPVLDSLGIRPIYYSTSAADRQTALDQGPVWTSPRALPSRHARLWQMVAALRGLTEPYVQRAYIRKVLQTDLAPSYTPGDLG